VQSAPISGNVSEAIVAQKFEAQPGGSFVARVRETIRYMRDTLGYYRAHRERGQEPFPARMIDGDFWCTGSSSLAKEIYQAPPSLFGDPVSVRILEPVLGSNSLLLLGGDEHKKDRKLMMPPFHGERMRDYGNVIQGSTLRRMAERERDESLSVRDLAQTISLDVILEAVFGVVEKERGDFERAVTDTTEAFVPSILFFDFLRFSFFPPWLKFARRRARLHHRVNALIEERRIQAGEGSDILSMLLNATYDDGTKMAADRLRDELMTMLMAGHETTAVVLTWAVYYVLKDASIEKRLRQELESVDASRPEELQALPYLGAICSEALRLHPVVPDVSRAVNEDWALGGQEVKRGDQVMVAISLIHEDPEIYPEPARFLPERFLEKTYKPWEFNPFGGGNRRCLGAGFAIYELRLALATLFSNYRLKLCSERDVTPVRRHITMEPNSDVRVFFEKI